MPGTGSSAQRRSPCAQAEGRVPLYQLDEPLDLQGPQFQQVLKEIGEPGGKWEGAQFEQAQTGNVLAGPYRRRVPRACGTGRPTATTRSWPMSCPAGSPVQEALDIAQQNWDESFEGLPEA